MTETSKRPYHTTKSVLADLLTSHEYSDVTGVVTTNVCDGLFAIANALNRLAVAHERGIERQMQTEAVRIQLAAQETDSRNALLARALGHAHGPDA